MEHIIGGKFKLGRKIGSGSFGELYLGMQLMWFLFVWSCNSRASLRNMADIDGVSFGLYRYKCTNWRGSGCQAGKWVIYSIVSISIYWEIWRFCFSPLRWYGDLTNCEILRSRLKINFFPWIKIVLQYLELWFWFLAFNFCCEHLVGQYRRKL